MTDDAVRTYVHTNVGRLEFQEYFVRQQCEPKVVKVEFSGAQKAKLSVAFDQALSNPDLAAIVICPSNPILSIDPILSLQNLRKRIAKCAAPVVTVSPIVGGKAINGPAAKLYEALGQEASALAVPRHYLGVADGIIIDHVDQSLRPAIEALGIAVDVAPTIMATEENQIHLAYRTIEFANKIGQSKLSSKLLSTSR